MEKLNLQAATRLTTIINGFKKCEIWTIVRNVFTEEDFMTAESSNTEIITTAEEQNELPSRSIASTSANLDNFFAIKTIKM